MVILTGALSVLGIAALFRTGRAVRIDTSPAACARLTLGMDTQQVSSVLGGPPGDYTGGRSEGYSLPLRGTFDGAYLVGRAGQPLPSGSAPHSPPLPKLTEHEWLTPQGGIVVLFDPQGKAVRVFRVNLLLRPSLRDRVLNWLVRAQSP